MDQETSSPNAFYRISVLTLLLVPEILEWDYFEEYVLQKGDQQVKEL